MDDPYRAHREACDAVATAADRTAESRRSDLDYHGEEAWRTFADHMRAISSGIATVEATDLIHSDSPKDDTAERSTEPRETRK